MSTIKVCSWSPFLTQFNHVAGDDQGSVPDLHGEGSSPALPGTRPRAGRCHREWRIDSPGDGPQLNG